jgi:hypothetical protein
MSAGGLGIAQQIATSLEPSLGAKAGDEHASGH